VGNLCFPSSLKRKKIRSINCPATLPEESKKSDANSEGKYPKYSQIYDLGNKTKT
jgi:hypothetical protein